MANMELESSKKRENGKNKIFEEKMLAKNFPKPIYTKKKINPWNKDVQGAFNRAHKSRPHLSLLPSNQ